MLKHFAVTNFAVLHVVIIIMIIVFTVLFRVTRLGVKCFKCIKTVSFRARPWMYTDCDNNICIHRGVRLSECSADERFPRGDVIGLWSGIIKSAGRICCKTKIAVYGTRVVRTRTVGIGTPKFSSAQTDYHPSL